MEEVKQEVRKIGACQVRNYKTGKPCGNTKWYPVGGEEYICSECLSPIEWTWKIKRQNAGK